MMRNISIIFCLAIQLVLQAQEKMYIHRTDGITMGALVSQTDSLYFINSGYTADFIINGSLFQIQTGVIDSITFGENSDTISINYNGTTASVLNPLAFEGVSVAVSGAEVTINSTTETKDIYYKLSGSTSDGMFKIYSEKRFNLLLNGVAITNTNGPAINIQSNNKASIELSDGTVNSLADGTAYADGPLNNDGETEDQKGTFFSEGKIAISGTGSLNITGTGTDKHAICSDDLIEIDGGTIAITSAANDAIHGKNGVVITAGNINLNSTGDGIDGDEGFVDISGGSVTTISSTADVKGITCDSTLTISGGNIDITVNGNQSKGISSGQSMTLIGGTININSAGGVNLITSGSGYDPAYCTAIKSNSSILIDGSNITITCSGIAGKGISSDSTININSGSVNITTTGSGAKYTNSSATADAYYSTCISADANINIKGGSVTVSSSGAGGRGIKADGSISFGDNSNNPVVNVTTTGSKITISSGSGSQGGFPGGQGGSTGTYAEAKAISSDGAVTINNGVITISSSDDGIKSTTSITINDGTVTISKSVEGMEGPFITVNGGNVSITASDDSFNATHGNGGESDDSSILTFNGGNISVSSTTGDGLDSNGSIVMTSGTVVAQGPSSQPEVAMDYNGTCNISGGLFIISGPNSGNMIQANSTTSSQYSVKITSSSIGTNLIHIQNGSGVDLVTYKPVRSAYYIIFSSSLLTSGSTYYVYTGGNYSGGTTINGYYSGGNYSGGTQKTSFTVSSKVTSATF